MLAPFAMSMLSAKVASLLLSSLFNSQTRRANRSKAWKHRPGASSVPLTQADEGASWSFAFSAAMGAADEEDAAPAAAATASWACPSLDNSSTSMPPFAFWT
jgi:hypothetical protein